MKNRSLVRYSLVSFLVVALLFPLPKSSLLFAAEQTNASAGETKKENKTTRWEDFKACSAVLGALALASSYVSYLNYLTHFVHRPANEAARTYFELRAYEGIELSGLRVTHYRDISKRFSIYLKETLVGKQYIRWLSFIPKSEKPRWTEQQFDRLVNGLPSSDQVKIRELESVESSSADFPDRLISRKVVYEVVVKGKTCLLISVDFEELNSRQLTNAGSFGSIGVPLPMTDAIIQTSIALVRNVEIVDEP